MSYHTIDRRRDSEKPLQQSMPPDPVQTNSPHPGDAREQHKVNPRERLQLEYGPQPRTQTDDSEDAEQRC
jgi:hypothetical protein